VLLIASLLLAACGSTSKSGSSSSRSNAAPKHPPAAVSTFATCMRKHGAIGKSPGSPQFNAAYAQCVREQYRLK
jgi:hypothetical protein